MCVLFVLSAALLQVNFGAGVEMEVQMLDLDRMQQDLVEADEGNAQTLDEIHSYGNGHVDHLEQLSRELEMEDSARAHVGAMLDRESNHFNKISAEDPNDVRARAHKEQSLESGLLSRLDDEIANVKSKKSPKRAHKKAASQNHAATKAAHVARKTKATKASKAHTKATKASKIDTVIDAAQDEENAILRLHNEEQHQLRESNNDSNDNDPMEEIATAEEPDATEGAAAAEGLTAFPTDPPDADSTASGNGVRVGGSVPTSYNAPDGDDDEESDDGATTTTTTTTDGATTTTTTTTTTSNAPDGDDDEESDDGDDDEESDDGRGILKESSSPEEANDDSADSSEHQPAQTDEDGIANHHKADEESDADPVTEHSEPKSGPNADANGEAPQTDEDGVPNHFKEDNEPPEAAKSTKPKPAVSAFSNDWSFENLLHQSA